MRVEKRNWASALGTLALLLAAGCSSKNPDALTGMNVDENLAIMNAGENMEVDGRQAEAPTANESSAAVSNQASEEAASTTPKHATNSDSEDRDVKANAISTISPDEPTSGDQAENNEDERHLF